MTDTPARRVKTQQPSDLGMALLNKQISELQALRAIVLTNEYNDIANAVFPVSEYTAANPSFSGEYKYISWGLHMSELCRFTDPKLTAVIDAMEAIHPDESKMKEYTQSFNRDYSWTWKFEDGYELRVSLSAYESKETSDYVRVQTGTRTKEEPVFEVVAVTDAAEVSAKLGAPVLQIGAR